MENFIKDYGELLITFSIISFIGTLVLVPFIIIRLPADYFSPQKRHTLDFKNPFLRYPFILLKNLSGAVLVLAGLIMLFTPGQGLITLLAGMMIMNYPGKYKLERWIILRFHLLKVINWYRARHQRPPMDMPE